MRHIGKFFLLGIFSTLIDYLLYILLLYVGVDYVLAIIAGYSAGLLFNYHVARRYIFSKSRFNSSRGEFTAVVAIALVGLALNIAIVKLLSFSLYELDPSISRVVAIAIVFFWNYYARKLFVYG